MTVHASEAFSPKSTSARATAANARRRYEQDVHEAISTGLNDRDEPHGFAPAILFVRLHALDIRCPPPVRSKSDAVASPARSPPD